DPPLDRCGASAVVHAEADARDDACDVCEVACLSRVPQRGLEVAFAVIPRSGASMQDRNELGLVLGELLKQQGAEGAVVAVPDASPVERDEGGIRVRNLLQLSSGAGIGQYRFDDGYALFVEERRSREEA